jgi:hypothetical protein
MHSIVIDVPEVSYHEDSELLSSETHVDAHESRRRSRIGFTHCLTSHRESVVHLRHERRVERNRRLAVLAFCVVVVTWAVCIIVL